MPPLLGEISAPPRENILAGLRTGTPLSSNPVIQLTDSASTDDVMCLPVARSNRMYDPLRSAWATSCHVIPPPCSRAKSFGHVSAPGSPALGVVYHFHSSSPVSGLRDSIHAGTSSASPLRPTMRWFLMTTGAADRP